MPCFDELLLSDRCNAYGCPATAGYGIASGSATRCIALANTVCLRRFDRESDVHARLPLAHSALSNCSLSLSLSLSLSVSVSLSLSVSVSLSVCLSLSHVTVPLSESLSSLALAVSSEGEARVQTQGLYRAGLGIQIAGNERGLSVCKEDESNRSAKEGEFRAIINFVDCSGEAHIQDVQVLRFV